MKLINLSFFALLILMLSCNAQPEAQQSDQEQGVTKEEVVTSGAVEKQGADKAQKDQKREQMNYSKGELKAVESTQEMLARAVTEFNLNREEQAEVAKMLEDYDYGSQNSKAQKDIRMKVNHNIRNYIKAPK